MKKGALEEPGSQKDPSGRLADSADQTLIDRTLV
jgi:hypothetical protein